MASYSVDVRTDATDVLPLTIEGGPYVNAVTPRYFDVVGTRVMRGRAFGDGDVAASRPVVVVNTTAARLWWRSVDALGRCVYLSGRDDCARVVGVVEDSRRRSVFEEPAAQVFVPLAQAPPPLSAGALLLRAPGIDLRRGNARETIVRALQAVAPDAPLTTTSVGALTSRHWRSWNRGVWAFGVIAVAALIIAAASLYDLMLRDRPSRVLAPTATVVAAVAGAFVVWLGRGWVEPLLFQTPLFTPFTVLWAILPMVVAAGAGAAAGAVRRSRPWRAGPTIGEIR